MIFWLQKKKISMGVPGKYSIDKCMTQTHTKGELDEEIHPFQVSLLVEKVSLRIPPIRLFH